MTPKEKAEELVGKFNITFHHHKALEFFRLQRAKEYALIAVEEVLNSVYEYSYEYEFYNEVKQEIENL